MIQITEEQLDNMQYSDLINEELEKNIAQKLQIQVIVGLFIIMFVLVLLILILWLHYRTLFSNYYDSKTKNAKKPTTQLVNPQFTPITKDLDMKIRRY